ncbi:MAG: DUF4410 domain-containing protein [Planctomycetes bacterium]|nr:DUF4410 domain-containing protein [Planctomycetota bacterium]
MRTAIFLLLGALALTNTGCAGLIMSVSDRNGSNESVRLQPGESVGVPTPTVSPEIAKGLAQAGLTESQFAGKIQDELVRQLKDRGVAAHAGPDGSTLKIHITRFTDGSGAARFLLSGSGIGDSKLDGSAILSTPSGRRELEIVKTGSKSGAVASGSQTEENIGYFATALASKIVGS